MQSSTAIAFRALIMLVVLISVPLFAIFGKNLPEVVKGLLEGRSLVLGPAPEATANSPAASPAPVSSNPFGQPAPYRAGGDSGFAANSAASNSAVAPNNNVAASSSSLSGAAAALLGSSNSTPGSASSPTGFAKPSGEITSATADNRTNLMSGGNSLAAVPAGAMTGSMSGTPSSLPSGIDPMAGRLGAMGPATPPGNPAARTALPGAQPANFLAPADASALGATELAARDPNSFTANGDFARAPGTASPGAPPSAATPSPSDDKFRRAEMRLRELGATHYMLETWGADNSHYRFVCKMAIGGNAEVNRVFQAVDEDPWQAMDTVLRQVEEWRARVPAQ